MASHRSTAGANRRAGLSALAAVVAVVATFLAIAGSLFAPSSASARGMLKKSFHATATVTRTIRATATTTIRVPGPTATVTATATVPGPTSTVTVTSPPSSPTTSPSATPSAPAGSRFPGDPGLGSLYVGESRLGGDPTDREKLWGTSVGVFRSYYQWNNNAHLADRAARDLAAGRLPIVSFHTATTWANIANGSQDAVLRDLMSRLAALKGPVWLSMDHEPYDNQADKGTPADFGNANKHLMTMIPSNVALVPILQSSPFDPTVGGSENIAPWFPPGSYTFIGLDTYNRTNYVPTVSGKYRDPATELSIVDLVRKELGQPDLPIAIAEFGTRTDPSAPGKAAQWLRDFVALAATKNIPAVSYFDSGLNIDNGGTPWSLDDTTDGTNGKERLDAYGQLVAAGAHLKAG